MPTRALLLLMPLFAPLAPPPPPGDASNAIVEAKLRCDDDGDNGAVGDTPAATPLSIPPFEAPDAPPEPEATETAKVDADAEATATARRAASSDGRSGEAAVATASDGTREAGNAGGAVADDEAGVVGEVKERR